MADFLTKGRYYEAEFPEVEDVIVVQINKINDKIGAYVSLLEYDNREAMIPITEISKRRIRSMAKLLRIGSTEVCMVVSVDKQKGYINCSKKRVTSEDVAPKLEAFAKAKAIHGVMQHTASTNNIPIEELCTKVAWPLDAQFGNALDAFKKHINGELQIWDHVDFSQPGVDLSDQQEKLKADIESVLQRRLITSSMRLQAKCEVSCSEYEGIDAIKAALKEGFGASKEDCEVSIKLIAHPLFALTCMCREKELGINVLDDAMTRIENAIKAAGGTFALKSKPSTLQQKEDGEEKDDDDDDDSSGSSSSEDAEDQDDTMGNLDADFTDIMKKKVDDDDSD